MIETAEVYALLLNEISIWSRKDNPVPMKKSPAKIPDIFAGLKPDTTSLFKNNNKIPNTRVIPSGNKIITKLCPSRGKLLSGLWVWRSIPWE